MPSPPVNFRGKFEDYQSPGCFFTRTLKSNVRQTLGWCQGSKGVSSPICSRVSMRWHCLIYGFCIGVCWLINRTSSRRLISKCTKWKEFDIHYRIFWVNHRPAVAAIAPLSLIEERNLLFTITIYLSPSDYHRVHSPTFFSIQNRVHFPGRLLPVKSYFVQKVKGLFTINERVVLNGSWNQGFFSLGMVGAYNVGSISLANPYDRSLQTNCAQHKSDLRRHVCHRKKYPSHVTINPGDEVGTFHVGHIQWSWTAWIDSRPYFWIERVSLECKTWRKSENGTTTRVCDFHTRSLSPAPYIFRK